MSAVAFDTLKFARRLEQAGLDSSQAATFAEAQKDAFAEVLDNQVATKADVRELRAESKADIHELRAEQRLMKWMLSFNLILSFAILSMVASILLKGG